MTRHFVREELEELAALITASNAQVLDSWRLEVRASLRGIPIDGALAKQITALSTSSVIASGQGRLLGWAVKSAGAAAELDLSDGRSADDAPLLAPIMLAANSSSTVWLGREGVAYTEGLFASVSAGAVTGAIWVAGVK